MEGVLRVLACGLEMTGLHEEGLVEVGWGPFVLREIEGGTDGGRGPDEVCGVGF